MFLYCYLLDADFFEDRLRPALTVCWLRRSFGPTRDIAAELQAQHPDLPAESLVRRVSAGLLFSRHAWQGLVGECLLFASVDLPRLPTSSGSLCALLTPEQFALPDLPRKQFAPIQQVHFGSRDLHFGGFYRPEYAGYNALDDVRRLLAYLRVQRPDDWSPEALTGVPELATSEERAEELADLREWWPELVALYQRAATERFVIVTEQM